MRTPPYFIGPLKHTQVGRDWLFGKTYQLTHPFGFVSVQNEFIPVPTYRIHNAASVPPIIRAFLRPTGSYMDAAVIHDELCDEQGNYDEKDEHRVFDMSAVPIQLWALRFIHCPAYEFKLEWQRLRPYSYQVDSAHALDIFYQAMSVPPSPTKPWIRSIIWAAINSRCGPHWTVEKKTAI